MDSNRIQQLLEKYWNAETSLEEETQLREYFAQKDIPEHLKETASLFQYFGHRKKKELNENFNHEVLSKVNVAKKSKVVSLIYNSMRIAAGIAVLVIAVWVIRKEVNVSDQGFKDTYDDPKLAYEETKKALLMISKSFGTAEHEARKLNLFNQAQDEIRKKPEPKKNL